MIGFAGLNIETERVQDQAFYRKNLTGVLKFREQDNCDLFPIIKGFTEDKTKYCELFEVRIEKVCPNETITNYLDGDFTVNKVKINYCRCFIEIEIRTLDDLTCLTDIWEEELDFFTQQTVGYEVKLGAIQTRLITQKHAGPAPGAFSPIPADTIPVAVDDGVANVSPYGGGDCDPKNKEWDNAAVAWVAARCPSEWWFQFTSIFLNILGFFGVETSWYREFLVNIGSPGAEWVNIGGNDWVRQPSSATATGNTQAMGFKNSFQELVDNTGCFTFLVSDFFDINPDGSAPANIAYTYAIANLQDLAIVSQSDIKDPTAISPAQPQIFIAALKDWLEDLQSLFNIVWFVEGNNLRVEHVSYLSAAAPIDICTDPCLIINKLEVPNRENFSTKEPQSTFFNGDPILYDIPCGEGTKERSTKIFNTDAVFIEDNAESFSNEGFVLVSTIIFNSVRYMNNYNKPLAFPNLHTNLWTFDRYFFEGNMNGVTTPFLTTKKIRQSLELNCTCQFDGLTGSEIISTNIGNGEIQKVTENLKNNSVKIQLNFE